MAKGIIAGYTMYALRFSLILNMLVNSAVMECRGPESKSGVRKAQIMAYMADLSVTSSVTGGRFILKGLEDNKISVRMYSKPTKSR